MLGIRLGYDEIITREINWDEVVNKMEKRLHFWKQSTVPKREGACIKLSFSI